MIIMDIIIICVIVLFAILGFKDGFLRKLFGLIGLLVGFILATKFMGVLGKLIIEWFEFAPYFSYPLAFFSIFLAVILVFILLSKWLGSRGTIVKTLNRVAGGILGAAQGVLIASIVLIALKFADIPSEETKSKSILYPQIINIAPKVFDFALTVYPESKSFFEEIEKNLKKYTD